MRIHPLARMGIILGALSAIPLLYGASNSIWNSVAVCSYVNTSNCLQPNSDGSLNVDATFGGSISIPSVGLIGHAAPLSADLSGSIDASGNLQGNSSTNPSWIQGSGTAGSPAGDVLSVQGVSGAIPLNTALASIGANNSTGPTSSEQIGSQDSSGNLQAASATHPIPVQQAFAPVGTGGTVNGNATVTGTGSTQLVAGVSGKKVNLAGWACSNSGATAVTVTFQDGSAGSQIGPIIEVPAGGGNNMAPGGVWAATSSGNGLYFAAGGSTTSLSCGVVGTQQ